MDSDDDGGELIFVGEEHAEESNVDAKLDDTNEGDTANLTEESMTDAKDHDEENGDADGAQEEKSSGGKEEHKDDNLMVVDEWDNDDVDSEFSEEGEY